jgi:hypothetical protein
MVTARESTPWPAPPEDGRHEPREPAVGHFEVAWQIAENVVVRSQDAVDAPAAPG